MNFINSYKDRVKSDINDRNNPKKRKMRYANLFLSATCLTTLLSSTGIFALKSSNILESTNIFQTDNVDISLKTITKGNITETGDINDSVYIDNANINPAELNESTRIKLDPGAKVSIIPTINNKGVDSYIRAYVNIDKDSGISLSNFSGISDKWKYNHNDGCFYYTDMFKGNDEVTLYNQLNIPTDYDKKDINFNVKVTVDAIQSRNFTPNFDESSPWGDVKIQKYLQTNVYQYKKADNSVSSLNITYNGDSNKLISNQEDFFTNLPTIVPGDSYKNTINVMNNFDKDINLYFEGHPNKDSKFNIQDDLLKEISLKITTDNRKEIYNGNLSKDIENQVILKLKPKETRQISYELYFDKEADNAYTDLDNFVKWYFNTSYDDTVPDNGNKDGNTGKVKTGDESVNAFFTLSTLTLLSGVGVIYTGISLKKMNKKED